MKLIIFLLAFTLHVFALEAYKPDKDFAPYFNPLNCSVVLDKFFYTIVMIINSKALKP